MTIVDFVAATAQLLGLLLVVSSMAAMSMRRSKPPAVQPLRQGIPPARSAMVRRRLP